MPEISRFYGIVIQMYAEEHPPPHFHARYSGSAVQIGINPVRILEGRLERRAMSLVLEWTAMHQWELMENWERMRRDELPQRIEPLEQVVFMSARITALTYAGDYRLELIFDDGLKSVVDFRPRLSGRGGIWAPLNDIEYFKKARIDPELQTIVWPNGADVCPDVLYSLAAGKPLPDARAGVATSVQE